MVNEFYPDVLKNDTSKFLATLLHPEDRNLYYFIGLKNSIPKFEELEVLSNKIVANNLFRKGVLIVKHIPSNTFWTNCYYYVGDEDYGYKYEYAKHPKGHIWLQVYPERVETITYKFNDSEEVSMDSIFERQS